MSLKEHGIEKFARLIRQNLIQAKYLTDLVEQSEELELTAPTATNIVCFRFNPGKNDLDLDRTE
jgi:glutamate/tyrosine decarboxylase-like PLP-dependent enzyme